MNILPSEYEPMAAADFIGPARQVAGLLEQAVKDATAGGKNAPIKILINGEPGIGKSSLAKYLIHLLDCPNKWSVKKYSGPDVDIDVVRGIPADLHYKDLFGAYRVIQIEEADVIPPAAQTRFLMLLDELPKACAVICTSNCKLDDFKKRFQTRFKMFELDAPQPEEVATLLRRFGLDPRDVTQISTFACGNVRAAMLDAETALQARKLAA